MIYLGTLVSVIGCMVLLDWRHRLFFFHRPVAASLVMITGMVYFLVWDLWAIDLGIFLHRESELMTGVMLAPQLPLEETFFLFFLSYLSMVLFTGLVKFLPRRSVRSAPSERAAGPGAQSGQPNGAAK